MHTLYPHVRAPYWGQVAGRIAPIGCSGLILRGGSKEAVLYFNFSVSRDPEGRMRLVLVMRPIFAASSCPTFRHSISSYIRSEEVI